MLVFKSLNLKVATSTCIIICGKHDTQKTTIREFMVAYLQQTGLVQGEPLVISTHPQVVQNSETSSENN